MSENTHKNPNYFAIFAFLVAAFIVSVILDSMSGSPWTIAAIFLIAAVKAYLVVMYFMHLSVEPRFLKVMVIGLIVTLAAFYIGVITDMVGGFGKVL